MKTLAVIIILSFNSLVFGQLFWNPTSNMSVSGNDNVPALTVNSQGHIFAASFNVGVYRSTNSGLNWSFSGIAGSRIYSLKSAPNGFLFALFNTQTSLNIHRSTDNGTSWQPVMTQVITNNFASGGSVVFVNDSIYVAALSQTIGPTIGDIGGRIYRTTDRGATWALVSTLFTGFTNDIVLTPTGRILAATSLGGVKASDNNGSSWSNTGYGIFAYRLAVNSLGHVFVGRWTAGDTSQMIYRSTDNGLLWFPTNCNGGNIRAVMIGENDILYAASENKVVRRSTDDGNTWQFITSGIPSSAYVQSLAGTGSTLYAGTNSIGVYRNGGIVSINGVPEIASKFSLGQNYPNPFNPVTNIKFTLPKQAYVKLTVYDIMGREVVVLADGIVNEGNHSVHFDASNLVSGVYFYKLTAIGYEEVRKMILIK
jgi:photosystem II stability/assembly factor-like uncharacterized protein